MARKASAASLALAALLACLPPAAFAADAGFLTAVPPEFVLFACTLLGVALFHRHTLFVGLTGLAAILAWKLGFAGFEEGPGLAGLAAHFAHEGVTLANLFLLLMGFALLARHFQNTRLPDVLPDYLPSGWMGGFALLAMVFVMSSFLDNIAAALIGGAMANRLFRERVHVGYLAAIVAASNAGGSGSVLGDTTTTMMWISGVSPAEVFRAYVAAAVALLVCGIPAALQQHRHSPIVRHANPRIRLDWPRIGVVVLILAAAVAANIFANVVQPGLAQRWPVIGLAVWAALIASAWVRRPDWAVLPGTFSGTLFLLSLVSCASLMPVDKLPLATWQSALGLGFVSAVFDNIPLTELALREGGYDWGFLAYAVGFGGSMLWFGSSAGVALANGFPEAKSVAQWLRQGWHVTLAYVVGFAVMFGQLGWHPRG